MTLTKLLQDYLDSGEADEALLAAVAELIRERIWKSHMWNQPPEFFGYPEYHTWSEAFSGDDPSPGPAGDFFLEEIVPEQNFLDQTIRAGNTVEALLRQKVRFFLTDRQKKFDPIGYRAFKNFVAVIEGMVSEGVASVSNRVRGKIRNPSIVRLTSSGPAPCAGEQELGHVIDGDPDWQPVLIRLAKLGTGAQRLLRARLDRFLSQGVGAFSVGEFGFLLKARARAANKAWNRPTENSGNPPNQDESRTNLENDRYSLSEEYLVDFARKVRQAVEGSDYTAKVKRGMLVVFEDWLKYLRVGNDHPPFRDWAIQLGLRKSSIADHYKNLRQLIRAALEKGQAD